MPCESVKCPFSSRSRKKFQTAGSAFSNSSMSMTPELLFLIFKASSPSSLPFDLISSADVVLIYGCSMGPTDRRWWKTVVDWMKGSASRFVVIASYGLEKHQRTARSFRDFTLGLREKLLESAGCADDGDKEDLFGCVLIIPSSRIFKLEETTNR